MNIRENLEAAISAIVAAAVCLLGTAQLMASA